MVKQKKNPVIALILNLIIWGVGYIYNGKRVGFGVLLLFADIIGMTLLSFSLAIINPFFWFTIIILSLAFAHDGYKEAKEINKQK
jgi:TM2 domain-containing membrane protein YozV